jgi:hypothetical protein
MKGKGVCGSGREREREIFFSREREVMADER